MCLSLHTEFRDNNPLRYLHTNHNLVNCLRYLGITVHLDKSQNNVAMLYKDAAEIKTTLVQVFFGSER